MIRSNKQTFKYYSNRSRIKCGMTNKKKHCAKKVFSIQFSFITFRETTRSDGTTINKKTPPCPPQGGSKTVQAIYYFLNVMPSLITRYSFLFEE